MSGLVRGLWFGLWLATACAAAPRGSPTGSERDPQNRQGQPASEPTAQGSNPGDPHAPVYWGGSHAAKRLNPAFAKGRAAIKAPCGQVTGVIVPHHLVAAPLLAAAFAGVKRPVRTVVLLTPDHRNISPHPVSASLASWRTGERRIAPAVGLASRLVEEGLIAVDERGFAREHAVGDLVPFIARAFPEARLLPLRFRGLDCGEHAAGAARLGERLAGLAEPDTLVVASVDFVHAKPQAAALALDEASARALGSLEPRRGCEAEVDSRLALVTLLGHAKAAGARRMIRLHRSDSHALGASAPGEVVSYQTAYLTRGESAPVSLLAAGDVMLGRGVTANMRARGDFRYPLATVADTLRRTDLAVATLEAQLVRGCPTTRRGLKLCADPRALEALLHAGIDVVSVANNHARDYGEAALGDSVRLLREAGIAVAGYDGPAILERKGSRFGFAAYDGIAGPFDSRAMAREVRDLRARADTVIVMMHWGREHRAEPHPLQRRLAAAAVAAGADLILGSHPHIVQDLGPLDAATVAWSLGNFVFDQRSPATARRGAVGAFSFCDGSLVRADLTPVTLNVDGRPSWADR